LGTLATISEWFPIGLHFLGLITVALLAVRKAWSRRGVAVLLAVLWGWMGWACHDLNQGNGFSLNDALGLTAVLQALLFSWMVVRPGPSEDGSRRGPWGILGGVLVAYAIAVHPLGGRLGLAFFSRPALFLGIPFPPVVFTLGVIFLLGKTCRPYSLFLAVPLLWAAAGCPWAIQLDAAHLWALRVVLVLGSAFILLPESDWRSRWRLDGAQYYETCLRHRPHLVRCLWCGVVAALGVLILWNGGVSFPHELLQAMISLGLLAVSAVLFWLTFTAWLSPEFRLVAWAAARGGGALWTAFRKSWRWALLIVIAGFVVYDVAYEFELRDKDKDKGKGKEVVVQGGAPEEIQKILGWQARFAATAMLLAFIPVVYKGRRRLVIEPFVDCTRRDPKDKDDEGKTQVYRGVDSDLRAALSSISDLYRVIDEALPSLGTETISVTVDVKDIGEMLKDAAGSGSSFKLWGVEVPVGFLFSLVSRLARGPRITGSVHGSGEDITLIAELSGGGRRETWRVHCGHLDACDRSLADDQVVRKLIDPLAYRITADLVSVGSPRWQAVHCFTKGLRHYRDTQRSTKDCNILLRKAEKSLLEAAHDDEKFAQCHYNLGIVYKGLGENGSAKAAFRKAIEVEPGHYDACYALAETNLDTKDYAEALWVCDSAVGIKAGDARAWDLRAYAFRQHEQARRNIKFALLPSDPAWEEILKYCQIGTALSWRRLCRLALSGRSADLEEWRRSALLCTSNLAVVLGRMNQFSKSEQIFRQAVQLVRHDPPTQVSFGKALYRSGRWDEACGILTEVFEDGLDLGNRVALWSILTRVRAYQAARAYSSSLTSKAKAKAKAKAKDRDRDRDRDREYVPARQAFQHLLDVMVSLREGERLQDLFEALEDIEKLPPEALPQSGEKCGGSESDSERLFRQAQGDLAAEGYGLDGHGGGWINLALRSCRFLRALGREEDDKALKPLARLEKSLAGEAPPTAEAESFVDLRGGLSKILQASGENLKVYVNRLEAEGRRYLAPAAMEANEDEKAYESRRNFHCCCLRELGLVDAYGELGPTILKITRLQNESRSLAAAESRMARESLEESIESAQRHWRWAVCQIRLAEAHLRLKGKASGKACRDEMLPAIQQIKEAIHQLEAMGSIQPRAAGLYELLAQAQSMLAGAPVAEAGQRTQAELGAALAYSKVANELNPERARERLTLVEVYSTFGDYSQATEEATIALSFGNDSEAFERIGASFWQRAKAASTRGKRRKVLCATVQFFSDALKAVEKESFDKDHPLDQMESHAWAHHWLGRFHCELMKHEIGIGHEEVAKSMGFKPLESLVNLANAYLEIGSYAKAEAAFLEAGQVVVRLPQGVKAWEVLDAPGEDRKLGELLIELSLGWARLDAEKGLTPESTSRLATETEDLVLAIIDEMEPSSRSSLAAALYEGIAQLHLRAGQVSESLNWAKCSLQCGFRSGAYLCLASALLAGDAPSAADIRQAREALRHAHNLDLRGLYNREINELQLRLQRLEKAASQAAAPQRSAPPPPVG
jgi:tetratricopeptide (TPR) repeat protein